MTVCLSSFEINLRILNVEGENKDHNDKHSKNVLGSFAEVYFIDFMYSKYAVKCLKYKS